MVGLHEKISPKKTDALFRTDEGQRRDIVRIVHGLERQVEKERLGSSSSSSRITGGDSFGAVVVLQTRG
jgi:hypothetical protein